jgi:hypothetical protein
LESSDVVYSSCKEFFCWAVLVLWLVYVVWVLWIVDVPITSGTVIKFKYVFGCCFVTVVVSIEVEAIPTIFSSYSEKFKSLLISVVVCGIVACLWSMPEEGSAVVTLENCVSSDVCW